MCCSSYRSLAILCTLVVSLLLLTSPVLAQKQWVETSSSSRVALIIANTNYPGSNRLTYPTSDAEQMEKALRTLGFKVITHRDRTTREMKADIDEFAENLSEDCVALFYYSGHGAQVGGENYLLPIDFQKGSMETIEDDAVNARRVLKKMEAKHSPLNIVVLDACRNNPFKEVVRGDSKNDGLAQTKAPKGTLIAYATAPDETAKDNGIYAQTLASEMQRPNMGLLDVFNNVSATIAESTAQTPWMASTGIRPFYFVSKIKPVSITEIETIINARRFEEAIPLLTPLAESGNHRAQMLLGFCYQQRPTVPVEAFMWMKKAAEQGDAVAMIRVARMYASGKGTTISSSDSEKWYKIGIPALKSAAEQEDSFAQYDLAICYTYGNGVIKDYAETAKWLRKTADRGNASSQYNLAICYTYGNGVTKDAVEAVKWFRKAADQGYSDAQYNLGLCYLNGNGVAKDVLEVAKWFRKAADQDNEDAQYNLGICYLNGDGVTKNAVEAVKWFRKAAGHSLAIAQYNLGYCYLNGKGVTKDAVEAVKWFRKAADQGDDDAQYNLGLCYEDSVGVTKNIVAAIKWHRKAADQGNKYAQSRLKVLQP